VTQLNVLAYSESFDDYLRLKDFRFEGSNDGVNYTPLHQDVLQYANRHEWQSFFFQDFTGYRYYRLYGLDNWGCYDYCNQMIIEEWEMLGYEGAQSANLSVAKTGPADTVHVGDIVDYDLMVTNMGPGDAMNVVLVDNLPAGMAFVAAVPSNDGTCTEAGGTVTCELGTIAVGDSVSVSIQGMLAAVAVSNKASVTSSAFDVSTGNNTATAVTQVACGQSSAVSDEPQSEAVPMLGQSVPNPLNSGTVIVFTLPSESKVALSVYDVGGRRVRALFEGRRAAGEHRMTWDGRDDAGHLVASGIYFYDLRVADRVQGRRKALVLR
jgi:uncharacterized repeat protein (TIGR01451 family)